MASRWLESWRRNRLFRKYVGPFVAVVLLALLSNGLLEIYFAYQENKAALAQIQREKALAAALRIEGFVKEIERQMGWTTQPHLAVAGGLDQRRLDYVRLLRQVPAITEVQYIDAQGREQLRISRLAMDVLGSGVDVSAEPRFAETRAGRTWYGPVYFRKESEPYMALAIPHGTGGAVSAAEVNLKFIWDVVSQIRIGTFGHAYVVDAGGLLIAHPDISLVLKKTDLSALPQVRAARAAPAASEGWDEGMIATSLDGRRALVAHTTIAPLGWIVVVEQPLLEAFAPLRGSILRTALLMLVGVLVSVAASLVLARKMARPIRALHAGAARIGGGDLTHRIDVKTRDELEDLAGEFNRMTARLRESYATLEQRVEERTRELRETLDQQTATAEVLRVISSSPTDVKPVLDAVAESAARVCGADDALVVRVEGDGTVPEAHFGSVHMHAQARGRTLSPRFVVGRAILERRTIHVPDIEEVLDEYPDAIREVRTVLVSPLIRKGVSVGAIVMRRLEPRPFSDAQVKLLETFADQAAIAIENVRLFKELEARNAALTESLNQQTATADILKVISSSPTDVQPVLDAVAQNATTVCGAIDALILRVEGGQMSRVAHFGSVPVAVNPTRPLTDRSVGGRVILECRTIQIGDVLDPAVGREYPESPNLQGIVRTILAVPLVREGAAIGAIVLRRPEVRLFTDKQIALLQTFADQAVIAIENVRLFKELEARNAALTAALDQQTATSEILRVISSSPTAIEPVMQAVVESAARLCEAQNAQIFRVEDGSMRLVARHGPVRSSLEVGEARPITRASVSGRTIVDHVTLHIVDLAAEAAGEYPDIAPAIHREGIRSTVGVPLLREGTPIGSITAFRTEVRPFSDKQIALLQTFADQAVIAIENVRLFKELESKNAAIGEALEQQTATAEILSAISASPTDVQPVFDTIVHSALRLLRGHSASVLRVVEERLHLAALTSTTEAADAALRASFPASREEASVSWHVVETQQPYVVTDVEADPHIRLSAALRGYRSMLIVPMVREGRTVGTIAVTREAEGGFSDDEVALLQTFADQAVIAIENVRLFTELQARTADLTRSVGELEALGEVGRAISSTLDLQRLLDTIVARATALAATDGGAIYEFEEATRQFHLRATHNFSDEFVAGLRATPLVYAEGAVGRAAAEREPVQIGDVTAPGAYESRVRDLLVRAGYRALLALPLLSEDHVVGSLVVNRRAAGEFPPRVVELLRTFASQSALAISNARLFREIETKSRELEAANRHKDEFLASMSHELRTPLNAVIGFSEVLLERMFGELNPKQEEYLNDILASGRHLLSLINDILDLAKIEAGRMELDLEEFELAQAIDNAVVLVRERATRKGLALETALGRGLGSVRGDQRKIKQVLLNLLSNAVKFTPEGGRIQIHAQRLDGQVEVSVTDTGIGIAAADQEAVFEEFRQVGTDYAKKHEGTGLGLTLSRKFVELHGGHIAVKSRLGEGSTFTFTLPVRAWPTS